MRNAIVHTANLKALVSAAHSLLYRSPATPGIGVVWGDVGLGKTTGARHICLTQDDAIWVEAMPDWSPLWMLNDIASELGAQRAARREKSFAAIAGALREQPRAIFIDEADRLCRRPDLVESLRAIHDRTAAPTVLIGMRMLPGAVRGMPQLRSRISTWVEFRPCDLADTRLLVAGLSEIEVADDLVSAIHRSAGGAARGVAIAVERLERFAVRTGRRRLALADLPAGFQFRFSPPPTNYTEAAPAGPARLLRAG